METGLKDVYPRAVGLRDLPRNARLNMQIIPFSAVGSGRCELETVGLTE